MQFKQLRDKIQGYLPPDKLSLVDEAYQFALTAHAGQVRESGEPYIEHPLQVALILAELQLDASTLAAALLHDVIENCNIPAKQIEAKFGAEVAKLVEATTKLGKLAWQAPVEPSAREVQANNLRKMLVAMAEDLRVVFIKLADRLHNMRTLDALSPEKQARIAQETMEIYAPLAHRLGIWELKWQLEDLAFRHLDPRKYRHIARMVAGKRPEREKFIAQIIEVLKAEFDKLGLRAEMSGRPKHIFSISQKMEKYAAKGKEFGEIYDLLALRVLVSTVQDCYTAIGVIHSLWHPLPGNFDDYIANPKPNGYQSLHTVVMAMGTPLEIQIRTREMHHVAEYGVAAHWRYKEGDKTDMHFEERIGWLRQLIDWHRELSGSEEFLESVKTDIFIDQVFVFTPKGEIKELPKGATPLDLAYRIHTELGHRCIGAKVNGRLMPLSYQLNNGDVVEILTTKSPKAPSQDWLSPHLGYIKTSHAREKIRAWFKKQERDENIERGREILEKEYKRLGLKPSEREGLAKLFNYDNVDDFLAAIGYGGISLRQIEAKLAVEPEQFTVPTVSTAPKHPASPIRVLGSGDMLTQLARCCRPVPGDAIIGYITRSRGVSVHRQDCHNVLHNLMGEEDQGRLIGVEWAPTDSVYPVQVRVDAWDRVGLVRDITTVVAEEKVNISAISFGGKDDNVTSTYLTLETRGLAQLGRLLSRIEGLRGVISVNRVRDEVHAKTESSS